MKIFNDPIHGRIEIPEYCVDIIDTIAFQRLRNLKQLGLTSYVFYGATHTRFEHSIGVCWLSGEWAKHLQRRHPELGITDDDIKTVMISGLVHDIGHGPFSHTFERFIKNTRPDVNYNHEDMTIKIFQKIGPDCGCEPDIIDKVCKIIAGIPLDHNKFLGHIVHNTVNGLDADKLDYFIRDSQCTSFAIGCDWKRVVYESSVKNDEIVFPYKMAGDIFNLYQN
jgi:deoxynucleoside triphosphate triphosphohydrolase SAMHD1